MTTFLKIILTASLVLFVASFTEAGSAIVGGLLKPLGAILFIIFLIGEFLHKEVVKHDQEVSMRMELAKKQSTSRDVARLDRAVSPEKSSRLATAH